MKHYNFDEVIERHGTSCVKFDRLKEMFGDENLIPLWVADMDFRTPDFIVEALKKRCEHEIFGYTFGSDEYYESIINWVHYKHNWKIQREWISYIPGIVKGIAFAIQCFTQKGDKVIIQPPVYHPFRIVPEKMKREVVYNPLKMVDGIYEMDFDHLESIIDDECKVLILCNPHNPGGIVWKKETLVRLADICAKHNILVISDEIHAEMAYPQYTHYPFASVSDTAASCSVTFMAPSKTFNIAGIVTSYAIVPNDRIREEFYSFLEAGEFGDGTIFAYTATTAAYTYGAEWLQQMRMYIMENVRFVEEFMKQHLPKIKVYPFASVSDTAASCSVTFMAPSKTFNIAGIVTSYAIVPNDRIREEFYSFLEAGEFGDGTIFAYTATTAAYTYGAEWLQQMRMYIMENVRFVEEFMKQHLPKIKVYQPQASFLVWLDCRELKLSQDELVHLFKDKAGLALNDGSIFGPGGEGHMRLNIGCPRSVLDKAMNALKKAVDKK